MIPNSCVSKPEWRLAREWNNWVIIAVLANYPEKMARMSQEYLPLKNSNLLGFETSWAKMTKLWLAA